MNNQTIHHPHSLTDENDQMFARQATPSLISRKLAEPDNEWKALSIKALVTFFNNPAKYLLEKRLGIYLLERAVVLDERENFSLDHLGKYMLDQELVTTRLSGSSLKDMYPLLISIGNKIPMTMAEITITQSRLENLKTV